MGIYEYLMTLAMYQSTALLNVEHSPTPFLPCFSGETCVKSAHKPGP